MNKLEKCIKRTNYVLGYSKPKFTEDEVKKITVKTLSNLFRVLWNRKGTWSDAV